MERSRRVSLLAIAALAVAVTASAQHDAEDSKLEVQHVAGKVYMLIGEGGNIGATVGADGILIVDDKYDRSAVLVQNTLKDFKKGPLRFILNTHWHGDHTGANPVLGKEAHIIAHTNVRKRLAEGATLFGQSVPPIAKEGWPVITFDDSVSVHFNGEEIKALHLPNGHTDGDSIVLFTESNVLHMGDHLFTGMFPFVDLENGGSVQGLTRNIGRVLERLPEGAKIIPGHGPLSSRTDLEASHAMLVATSDVVRSKMDAGKSLDTIKAEGLPGWESWSWQFIPTERWIEIVYNSFQK